MLPLSIIFLSEHRVLFSVSVLVYLCMKCAIVIVYCCCLVLGCVGSKGGVERCPDRGV